MIGSLRWASRRLGYGGRVQFGATQPDSLNGYDGSSSTASSARVPMRVKLGFVALVALVVYRRRSRVVGAAPVAEPDPISPELVLIDSSLRERLVLKDSQVEAEVPNVSSAGAAEAGGEGGPFTRRRTLTAAVLLAAAVTAGVGITLLLTGHRSTPAHTSVPAVSTASRPSPSTSPRIGSPGRDFAWAPVKGASRYDVQIRRAGRVIYSSTTSAPRVRIPREWQRSGRTLVLSPGTYQWYVWPVVGSGAGSRRGAAVVATTFAVR